MKEKSIMLLGILAVLLTGCGEEIPPSADDPSKAEQVTLRRVYQYTYRYDCDGNLEEEGFETITHPRKSLQIFPEGNKTIVGSDFDNLTTGDNSVTIYNRTTFTIDLSPTVFNLRVREGINEIQYRFQFTDDSTEEGSRFIDVQYDETYRDDSRRIDPTEAQCEEEDEEV